MVPQQTHRRRTSWFWLVLWLHILGNAVNVALASDQLFLSAQGPRADDNLLALDLPTWEADSSPSFSGCSVDFEQEIRESLRRWFLGASASANCTDAEISAILLQTLQSLRATDDRVGEVSLSSERHGQFRRGANRGDSLDGNVESEQEKKEEKEENHNSKKEEKQKEEVERKKTGVEDKEDMEEEDEAETKGGEQGEEQMAEEERDRDEVPMGARSPDFARFAELVELTEEAVPQDDGEAVPARSAVVLLESEDSNEVERFHNAASQCRADDVKELLTAGSVDITEEGGRALTKAALRKGAWDAREARRCIETLRVLVDFGADRNFQDQDEDTALHIVAAKWYNFPELGMEALTLLASDKNKNLPGEDLFTPLTHVAKLWRNSTDVASQAVPLLLTKENVNTQTVDGMAALHYVCWFWLEPSTTLTTIKLLVAGGADRNLQAKDGGTPLVHFVIQWAGETEQPAAIAVEAIRVLVTPENKDIAMTEGGSLPLVEVAHRWAPTNAALSALEVLMSPTNRDFQDEARYTALHYVLDWTSNVEIALRAVRLLATKTNIDLQQQELMTPLHSLAAYWYVCPKEALTVMPLLAAGKAKDIAAKDGGTPLFLVAKNWARSPYEGLEAIKILRTKQNVNMRGTSGYLAIHWIAALWSRSPRAGLEALKLIATPKNKNMWTSDSGWMAVHKIASLWSGTDVYADALKMMWTPENLNSQNQAGNSILHLVAELSSDMDLVLFFATRPGVACDLSNKVGDRPLHLAAKNQLRIGVEDISTILACSGQVNAANRAQRTSLFFAGRPGVVRTLVEAGGKIHWLDESCDMSVHTLARHPGRFGASVMQEIVDLDPSLANEINPATGVSPLHDAAIGGQSGVVTALLHAGADVNVESRGGQTPLHYATNPIVAHALLDSGANSSHLDEDRRSPLQVSAQLNDLPMVELLLSRNAVRPTALYPNVTGEVANLLSKDESWEAIHFAAWSCEFYSTSRLLLDDFHIVSSQTKAPESHTPVKLATLALEKVKALGQGSEPVCRATLDLLKNAEDRSREEKQLQRRAERIKMRRRGVDLLLALVTILATSGYLLIHLLISQLKTLRNRGFLHQVLPLVLLWVTCFAGILRTALLGKLKARRTVAPVLGLVLYTLIFVVVFKAKPGSKLEALTMSWKQRCRHRLRMEQGWERAEFTIKLLFYLSILILEASLGFVGPFTSSSVPLFVAVTLLACSVVIGHFLATTDEDHTALVRRMDCAGAAVMIGVVVVKIMCEPKNDPFGVFLLCSWTLCLTSINYSGTFVHRLQSVSIEIAEVLHFRGSPSLGQERSRFVGRLMLGHPLVAANGLEAYLGLTSADIARGHQDGLAVMEEEVRSTGDVDDIENFLYVTRGTSRRVSDMPANVTHALSTGVYHGGTLKYDDFDTGAAGRTLDDWMQLEEVKVANLTKAEFVAVRFYTSSSFPRINGPLRSRTSEGGRHPWAMVVYFLASGIKKLRSVRASSQYAEFTQRTVLWRGMKNMDMDLDVFKRRGGTEFAAMSTTLNEAVARAYCESTAPLLFKFEVEGMRAGVSVQFLSLFPKEEEYLYPPLTYMTFKRQYQDDNVKVVVVEPVMS